VAWRGGCVYLVMQGVFDDGPAFLRLRGCGSRSEQRRHPGTHSSRNREDQGRISRSNFCRSSVLVRHSVTAPRQLMS
jgi:hypothetical protein